MNADYSLHARRFASLLLVVVAMIAVSPAIAATITPVPISSFTNPATQDFSSVTPPQVLPQTDPLFTSIGIVQATPSATQIRTNDAYSFNNTGPALFAQIGTTNPIAIGFGDTEATPASWTFDLDDPTGMSGYTQFGFGMVDSDIANPNSGTVLDLDFYNDGMLIATFTTVPLGAVGATYGFQSDELFDRVVLTFAGPPSGVGSDTGFGLDDLTLGGFQLVVPEPSTGCLMAMCGLGLVRCARRRRSSAAQR